MLPHKSPRCARGGEIGAPPFGFDALPESLVSHGYAENRRSFFSGLSLVHHTRCIHTTTNAFHVKAICSSNSCTECWRWVRGTLHAYCLPSQLPPTTSILSGSSATRTSAGPLFGIRVNALPGVLYAVFHNAICIGSVGSRRRIFSHTADKSCCGPPAPSGLRPVDGLPPSAHAGVLSDCTGRSRPMHHNQAEDAAAMPADPLRLSGYDQL